MNIGKGDSALVDCNVVGDRAEYFAELNQYAVG